MNILTPNLVQLMLSGAIALVAASGVLACVRFGGRSWMIAALLSVPVALLFLDGSYRDANWHGFMHASIVYQIVHHGVPPEDPLMAGQPLLYPYVHHVMVAGVIRMIPITPTMGFALTGVLAAVATCTIVYQAAKCVSPRPTFATIAVVVSLAGGPLVGGPAAGVMVRLLGIRELRHLPFLKFTDISSNHLGLALATLALLGLLRIAGSSRGRAMALTCLGVGLVGTGWLYPICWLPTCIGAGLVGSGLLLSKRFATRASGAGVLLVTCLTTVAVVPAVIAFTTGKTAEASIHVMPENSALGRNLLIASTAILPMLLLCWMGRQNLMVAWNQAAPAMRVLAVWILLHTSMFMLVSMPDHAEYKFLMLALVPLGILSAMALDGWYRSRPFVWMVLMAMLLTPVAWHFATVLRTGWPALDPTVAQGWRLRHQDMAQDALYCWIAEHTPSDAVFIDTYLSVPVLGRRSLFVGLDARRRTSPPGNDGLPSDGWTITSKRMLEQIMGHGQKLVETRIRLATALLDPVATGNQEEFIRSILQQIPGRKVYVVARQPHIVTRLSAAGGVEQVYQGVGGTVFRLVEQTPPGAKVEK